MDDYAKEGLRTLLFAQKTLGQAEYNHWAQDHLNASLSLANREEMLENVAEYIEQDFEITGSTAIEDRLQDGVPDAIIHIRQAGIKLWVLTGDKIETAINVGYSSGLLDDFTDQYILDAFASQDIYRQMCEAENDQNLKLHKSTVALIVGGDSLLKITNSESLQEKFL